MSADASASKIGKMLSCASCGIAGGDDVKLKDCSACKLVKYCGIECQRRHRPKHKNECKRRAAELRDEILFKQPDSSDFGDCPICCLPLSIDFTKSSLYSCCSKLICSGCDYANYKREIEEKLQSTCPFCRHPIPTSNEEGEKNLLKRVAANDPVAMTRMGVFRRKAGDHSGAVEYFTKAATFGNYAGAHYELSLMYYDGHGVEKDEKKYLHHLEFAAIGGNVLGRYNLGCAEGRIGRLDRAVKHFIIAANMGDDRSLENLKFAYRKKLVSKEDFAAVLRAHKAAVDATKSPQREEAEQWYARDGQIG